MSKDFFCAKAQFETSTIVLFGIPFDATSSFRPGSRFAPDHIRLYSEGIESYSPYQHNDLADCALYDAGNIEITIGNFQGIARYRPGPGSGIAGKKQKSHCSGRRAFNLFTGCGRPMLKNTRT